MDLEQVRAHCLALPETEETFPFGPDVLVFKVVGKMFALTNLEGIPTQVSLKCDPAEALALRARWAAVDEGYHLSKKHWNTITLNGTVPSELITSWIDASYDLVVASLKKADRVRVQTARAAQR